MRLSISINLALLRGRIADHATRCAGFSTLEMVLVLPIAAIIAAVGMSSVRQAVANEEIDAWARSMTYDLAAGRQAAITRRTTVTVTMADADGNSASTVHPGSIYTVGAGGGGTLRQATLPSHITVTTTCPSGACSFDRRGVPVAAGTITLTTSTTGRTFTITIEAGTGRASYSEP